jgi:hypothetical protein
MHQAEQSSWIFKIYNKSYREMNFNVLRIGQIRKNDEVQKLIRIKTFADIKQDNLNKAKS